MPFLLLNEPQKGYSNSTQDTVPSLGPAAASRVFPQWAANERKNAKSMTVSLENKQPMKGKVAAARKMLGV